MKIIIFMAIIAFVAANYYDVERIEINELIKNTDEIKRFVDCELEKKECSKLYSTYRSITQEAVVQACKKCSPYQKHSFWKFLQEVIAKFPNDYLSFRQKYDPENKYFDVLESELKKYSITY